jgi:methyl-accepting chemotaxis protein
MKLQHKLFGLSVMGVVTTTLVGLTAFWALSHTASANRQAAAERGVQHSEALAQFDRARLRSDVYSALFASEQSGTRDRTIILKRLEDHATGLRKSMDAVQSGAEAPEIDAQLRRVSPLLDAFLASGREIAQEAFSNRAEAVAGVAAFERSWESLSLEMDRLTDLIAADAADTQFNQKDTSRNAVIAIFGVMILGALATLDLAWRTSRRIARTVGAVAERLERLRSGCLTNFGQGVEAAARGDLQFEIVTATDPLEVQGSDEVADLGRTFNAMMEQTSRAIVSFDQVRAILRDLTTETGTLVQAARDGKLGERGDARKFRGTYRELVEGINATLDAVVDPINEAATVLERVAEKDLTARVVGDYRGDHARIKEALNGALDDLGEALAQVSAAAGQVGAASEQINYGSQTLAQSASDQASSLEEVSSSLQEMSSMSKQNSANSQEANSLAEAARGATQRGMASMGRLSEAVERIKSSADHTAKIIKTIDEIAFQTNLLALNAAVEAARAGEAGKGFAVVAEEVRNLAMRSAEAARNTSELIEGSVKNAEEGVELNREVLRNLDEISGQVNKVREVMAEIAAASEQQTQGVDQINLAVEQMNGLTQASAANSEESASAAEELSSQAAVMLSLVRQFQLEEDDYAAPPPPPARKTRKVPALALSGPKLRKNGNGNGHGRIDPEKLIPFDDDDTSTLEEF